MNSSHLGRYPIIMSKLVIGALFLLKASNLFATESIPLLTYHIAPPFIDANKQSGFSYELADYLTAHSNGRFKFNVEALPRKRLNQELNTRDFAVIPWVNPAWFGDSQQSKYLWTSGYVKDGNVLLSLKSNPLEYRGGNSLIGTTMVGMEGTYWQEVSPFIDAGKIVKLRSDSYLGAIKILSHQRAEATIMPELVAKALIYKENLLDKIHTAKEYHSKFDRHFLIKGRPDIKEYLESVVREMPNDPQWNKLLKKNGY